MSLPVGRQVQDDNCDSVCKCGKAESSLQLATGNSKFKKFYSLKRKTGCPITDFGHDKYK
jgi:hypothetical protein